MSRKERMKDFSSKIVFFFCLKNFQNKKGKIPFFFAFTLLFRSQKEKKRIINKEAKKKKFFKCKYKIIVALFLLVM